jgi:hypothetical protein
MNGAELGIVVATYPEGSSIDVVMIKDGSRLSNVQVATSSASSNTGIADLADIGAPAGDTRWDITQPVERLVRGIIMFVQGVPICTGFLFPQVGQMTFQRKNFKVERHASDVYSTINASGDMETYHPSGSYFRIGASPAHEDLTGQDYDRQWKIANNTGSAVHAHLAVANAGSIVATVDIDPQGNVTLMHRGNLTTTTTGNATLNVSGTTTINSTGNLSIQSQGNVTVNTSSAATLTANGGVTISGGGAVSITGALVSLN